MGTSLLPILGVEQLPNHEADALLTSWGHYLGPCARPFGKQSFVLHIDGRPVSMATSASTVSATVRLNDDETLARNEVVELARLCSAPGASDWTRVMLRAWRNLLALSWPHWQVRAAVAYSQNAHHPGHVYRTDGWTKARETKPSGGGGQWSGKRAEGHAAHGVKTLWVWRYEQSTLPAKTTP